MYERRSVRKWIWWGAILLVIAIAAVVAVIVINNNSNKIEVKQEASSKTEETPIEEKEEKTEEKIEEKSEGEEKPKVKQYEGENPNKSETLTGVISYAGVSGDNLIVRVNIDQYLSNGSCKLSLMRDGATIYNSTVGIESSVSTSTCDGFVVPVAQLRNGGAKIEVTLESGEKYGKITGEVEI